MDEDEKRAGGRKWSMVKKREMIDRSRTRERERKRQ